MSHYRCETVSDHLIRISTPNESMYLVIGKEKAALLDTGNGLKGLDKVVASYTSLPIIVLHTHGHVDHVNGSMYFKECYLNERDWEIAYESGTWEKRKEHILGRPQDGFTEEDIETGELPTFLPLHDGDVFDIGGIHLRAISLPGHSPGSMVILNEEERWILLGDACTTMTFLFLPTGLSIEEYRDNLISFHEKWIDSFDTCYFQHFEKADKSLIEENIRICQEIMDGVADDQPFDVPFFRHLGGTPLIAKRVVGSPRDRIREDGKVGNIVYSKENIFRKGNV